MSRLRPTSILREWIDRLLGTLRARRADADLQAELQSPGASGWRSAPARLTSSAR